MDASFHYPPELMQLLIDTIPRLCRSKPDVMLFLKGAGLSDGMLSDLAEIVRNRPKEIDKFKIVRTALQRINEQGDATLRQRREVLRRVVEFEDFSTCWENDQLKAKGLVAEIRRVVGVKDSFTRMNQERQQRIAQAEAEQQEIQRRKADIEAVKSELCRLFRDTVPQRRGKALEAVLNKLFALEGILVREAFTIVGTGGEGIVEQIDGVVAFEGELYLVELKWLKTPMGRPEASDHLVRIYHRGQSRGILISASGYSDPAIAVCREALQRTVVVLWTLEEIVLAMEQGRSITEVLKQKIAAAVIDKNPFVRIA
jgi:restriction system protein